MALKIRLKPGERIILGNTVVRNGPSPAEIVLENKVPVLREKDILTPDRARTACQILYLIVQLMYIDSSNVPSYQQAFWKVTKEILEAVPSTFSFVEQIARHILRNEHYRALKVAEKLVRYEEELLADAEKQHVGV